MSVKIADPLHARHRRRVRRTSRPRRPRDIATEELSPSRSRGFGGEPARLDEAAIDFLHSREEPDGVIHARPLPSGSSSRITDGSWRAIVERRVSARGRVLVLLDIPQRQTRVQMPETWVPEVPPCSTAPP